MKYQEQGQEPITSALTVIKPEDKILDTNI